MKCNKIALATALVLGLGTAGSASAETGLITFTGSVTDSTCAVSGGTGTDGGTTNFIVDLAAADAADLATAGSTAQRKDFQIIFSNGNGGACAAALTSVDFSYSASSPNVNTNGRLRNILTAAQQAATNVDLQILDGTTPVDLTQGTVKNITLSTTGPTTTTYGVQYFATGAATVGGVRSNVIYNAVYN
jgi:major type 1 subunit fimbrin (pilin)